MKSAAGGALDGLPYRQLLIDDANTNRRNGIIVLGTLRYRFYTIDTLAVRDGLLSWDNATNPPRLLDVAGRSRSPYILNEAVVAAALADSLAGNGAVSFRLDARYLFTNTGATLTSASINFDDGGVTRTLTPGQTVAVNYGSTGYKTLRYTLFYADGGQFTTCSRLWVRISTAPCPTCRTLAAESPCHSELVDSDIEHPAGAWVPPVGLRGRAEVSYYYRSTPQGCQGPANVRKPVIVVDGFDHNQERNGGNIYNEYLSYSNGTQIKNLGEDLRIDGYDVVIMDQPDITGPVYNGPNVYQRTLRRGGSDYMERNAYALVKLIQNLNQQMQAATPGTTEQIVVIGPSMGGQIARFALAYMEKRYNDQTDAVAYQNPVWQHNTRLYISLDSPHNGATIPIGLQHFVNIFATATGDTKLQESLVEVNSPAARELAQQHYTQGTAATTDPLRTNFVNELNGLGSYPNQLRRVAVTNGALSGTRQRDQNGQTIQAGQQVFFLEQKGMPCCGLVGSFVRILWLIGGLARHITTASARVYYGPDYGQVGRVARTYIIKPGASHGERTPEATGVPGSCSLDGAPGGYRPFFKSFLESTRRDDPFEKRTIYSPRDKACFIPMLSALGYNQPADNCANLTAQNLVCAGTTPFDAYYGPAASNEAHIQLTPGNVAFMRSEIMRTTPAPVFTTAPATVCPDGIQAVFTVATECARAGQPGTTYTWTLGNGLQYAPGSTGTSPSQTVRAMPGYRGTATLQVVATRTGYVASAPAVRYPDVADGSVTISHLPGTVSKFESFQVSLGLSNATGPNTWSVSPSTTAHITAYNGASITLRADRAGFVTITGTATNACNGSALTVSDTLTISHGYFRPVSEEAAYPNPADNVLHLTVAAGTSINADPRTAVLYNAQGREVARTTAAQADQLRTAGLPEGLYYLRVEQNGRVTRSQIRVQH